MIYTLGAQEKKWDNAMVGFVVITEETILRGGHMLGAIDDDYLSALAEEELGNYTQWANGEVYRYTLHDENGELEEDVSGFYSLREISDNLPIEWQEEELHKFIKDATI